MELRLQVCSEVGKITPVTATIGSCSRALEPGSAGPNLRFRAFFDVTGGEQETLAALDASHGKDIRLFGGGLLSRLAEDGLVDTV